MPSDREAVVYYPTQSAEQGNAYAQFILDHISNMRTPSVDLAAMRMFRHMANIFRDITAQGSSHMGLHIDHKRRLGFQEKHTAIGHKKDDHEY